MSDPHAVDPGVSGASREEILSALFAQLVLQQANTAMFLLGKTPHPQTGRTMRDLEGARMFIDQLEMLEARTKGNLSKEEQALLKQSLLSLHLAFVEAAESPEPAAPAPSPAPPAQDNPAASASPAAGSGPAPQASEPEAESRTKFSKKY